jgi:hypothetical protein
MTFYAVTSLTRVGVESCVDFLEVVAPRLRQFWLPLPRELCQGRPVDLGPLERYLEPLLALYYEVDAPWQCYETAEDLKRREAGAVRLASLVIKARAYGRIDLSEWDRLFQRTRHEAPTPSLVFGTPPARADVIICGTHPPNPLEAAADLWHKLPPALRLELAKWVTTYVSNIVESVNLDEAYFKTIRDGWDTAYRRIIDYITHVQENPRYA